MITLQKIPIKTQTPTILDNLSQGPLQITTLKKLSKPSKEILQDIQMLTVRPDYKYMRLFLLNRVEVR